MLFGDKYKSNYLKSNKNGCKIYDFDVKLWYCE